MLTNDIKKGMKLKLRNGFSATMIDNKKGNIRLCEVEGYVTEMGSVYASDIMWVSVLGNETWVLVTLTDAQKKFKAMGY